MTNRLATAISPYLRSHAENPVDWYPWGEEAFAEAKARNVPVLVSIGYSTCHWCHVMARESFGDPVLAARLNAGFVAIKVDREEHPEVDSAYLAAAGAFTQNLGWPLNVFTTPDAKVFFGGTYSPPVPIEGHASFGQVLDAVTEAWTTRHDEVVEVSERIASALAESGRVGLGDGGPGVPDAGSAGAGGAGAGGSGISPEQLSGIVAELGQYEDAQFGGFGGAPKFPVAPVLRFLLEYGTAGAGDADTGAAEAGAGDGDSASAFALAARTLRAMAASDLRDPVEGGFFRYATRRDWSEPHYERMLYDNALLLDAYSTVWAADPTALWAREAAEGIARFLIDVMQLPSGGFASAQDSESTVDGQRVEGGYYRLDAAARTRQTPPALAEKVLTGWNGLAIGALAHGSLVFDRDDWAMAASMRPTTLLTTHLPPASASGSGSGSGSGSSHHRLVRASSTAWPRPRWRRTKTSGCSPRACCAWPRSRGRPGMRRRAGCSWTRCCRTTSPAAARAVTVERRRRGGRRRRGTAPRRRPVERGRHRPQPRRTRRRHGRGGRGAPGRSAGGFLGTRARARRAGLRRSGRRRPGAAPPGSRGRARPVGGGVPLRHECVRGGGAAAARAHRRGAIPLRRAPGARPARAPRGAAADLVRGHPGAPDPPRPPGRPAGPRRAHPLGRPPRAWCRGRSHCRYHRSGGPSDLLRYAGRRPSHPRRRPTHPGVGGRTDAGRRPPRRGTDGHGRSGRRRDGGAGADARGVRLRALRRPRHRDGAPTAYRCLDFVCRLPTTEASGLAD